MSQPQIADLFGVDRTSISKHLKNVFDDGELDERSTCEEISHVGANGQTYKTTHYKLDAIIAVGYRISSLQATRFRQWATATLKEYVVKGFVLDDDRLKQGKSWGKDYFDELLERIREIRASERRFYQKITDIFKDCSVDYQSDSKVCRLFYSSVQNKLHWAITGNTAAELIQERADHEAPNMGLQTWKGSPDSKIHTSDVKVAKNYLSESELKELNQIVSLYLEFAELQATRKKTMTMQQWASRLDAFLELNDYKVLQHAGSIKAKVAQDLAVGEYKKFRVRQDQEYLSDFDNMVKDLKPRN